MSANKVGKLAYWYLRLNGYFTVEDFSLHPDTKNDRGTDADLLAVRFPFSQENPGRHCFERDTSLIIPQGIDFLLVEVKAGICYINSTTWGNPKEAHVQYALRWIGFWDSEKEINEIAAEIYETGMWTNQNATVRFCCIGKEENFDLQAAHPKLVQKSLSHVVDFVRQRFTHQCLQIHHENWDTFCQEFAERSKKNHATTQDLLDWILDQGA